MLERNWGVEWDGILTCGQKKKEAGWIKKKNNNTEVENLWWILPLASWLAIDGLVWFCICDQENIDPVLSSTQCIVRCFDELIASVLSEVIARFMALSSHWGFNTFRDVCLVDGKWRTGGVTNCWEELKFENLLTVLSTRQPKKRGHYFLSRCNPLLFFRRMMLRKLSNSALFFRLAVFTQRVLIIITASNILDISTYLLPPTYYLWSLIPALYVRSFPHIAAGFHSRRG